MILDAQLYQHLPRIRRSVGHYLYAEDGNRYIDCFQEGGFAILGHRDRALSRTMKNSISHGLWGSLPSIHISRYKKAISKLLAGWHPRGLFFSWEALAASLYTDESQGIYLYDSATEHWYCIGAGGLAVSTAPAGGSSIFLWRPFMDTITTDIAKHFDYLVPVVPFSLVPVPLLLCSRDDASPLLFRAASFLQLGYVRAVYNLMQAESDGQPDGTSMFPDIGLPDGWKRKGRYLLHGKSQEEYYKIHYAFLQNMIFLPPGRHYPIFIPLNISEKEIKRYIKTFSLY